MKWLRKHLGMGLIVLGAVLLTALHLLQLTFVHILLLIPLCLILTGLFLHVRAMKEELSANA